MDRARAIALSRSALQPETQAPSAADEHYGERREAEKTAALKARRIPEEEMIRTGKAFIVQNYGLNEEQTGRLELYTQSFETQRTEGAAGSAPSDGENTWYEMINGKPCFQVEYLLYTPSGANGTDPGEGLRHAEMDGFYNVFVNVETGEIEEFEYNSALAGIG
jgi:hypothetical protein